jgi:hypothetical protein
MLLDKVAKVEEIRLQERIRLLGDVGTMDALEGTQRENLRQRNKQNSATVPSVDRRRGQALGSGCVQAPPAVVSLVANKYSHAAYCLPLLFPKISTAKKYTSIC